MFRTINRPIRTRGSDGSADTDEAGRGRGGLAPNLRDPSGRALVRGGRGRGPPARRVVGTLYRNGPGRNEVGGRPYAHLFDGDGLLSQFAFDGKRVHYRNRYVRTTHYLAERAADKPVLRNYGQQRPGGPLANAFRMPANVANTSVQYHAGKLLALYEGRPAVAARSGHARDGRRVRLRRELERSYTYSAHPTWDPATRELYNFGIQYGPRTKLRTYRVDTRGKPASPARDQPPVRDPQPRLRPHAAVHGVRARSPRAAGAALPARVREPRQVGPLRHLEGDAGDPRARDGGRPRIAECEPFFHYHINNAFDDGTDVVLDLVRYPDYDNIHRGLREPRRAGFDDVSTTLSRMRVGPAGDVTLEDLLAARLRVPAA